MKKKINRKEILRGKKTITYKIIYQFASACGNNNIHRSKILGIYRVILYKNNKAEKYH